MPRSVKVSQIMTTEVVSLLEEQNLAQVAAVFQTVDFHHLPVVDGSRLVGMVSQRDLLRAGITGRDQSAVAKTKQTRHLEETFVRETMRTNLVTVRADETVQDAARRMLEARVDALPVISGNGFLIGIVTAHDLLRFLSLAADVSQPRV